MKQNRHGQASPMTPELYRLLRDETPSDNHKLLIDTLWFTGERIGAIVQLLFTDVYRDSGKRSPRSTIVFRAEMRKDNTTREVPIHPIFAEKLKAYTPSAYGWLFPGKNGNYYTVRSADAMLRRALSKLGLLDAGYSLHSFRRGFITRLHDKGIPIKTIQSLTGHKSLNMLSRYIEVTDEMRKSAIALL